MTATPDSYERDAKAVYLAVCQWQADNPHRRPVMTRGNATVFGPLHYNLPEVIVQLDDAARELLAFVRAREAAATWLMFVAAWELVYVDTN